MKGEANEGPKGPFAKEQKSKKTFKKKKPEAIEDTPRGLS